MATIPPHPTGHIIYYDGNTNTVVNQVPIHKVPEAMRFVCFKQGEAVDDAAMEVTEVVRGQVHIGVGYWLIFLNITLEKAVL